jgi:hypothetical protein
MLHAYHVLRTHSDSQFAARDPVARELSRRNKITKRTLAIPSAWPAAKIEALRCMLREDVVAPTSQDGLTLVHSLPHGPLAAVVLRKLGLAGGLSRGRQPARIVALCVAMIAARVIDPASKLATARVLDGETASCWLGAGALGRSMRRNFMTPSTG